MEGAECGAGDGEHGVQGRGFATRSRRLVEGCGNTGAECRCWACFVPRSLLRVRMKLWSDSRETRARWACLGVLCCVVYFKSGQEVERQTPSHACFMGRRGSVLPPPFNCQMLKMRPARTHPASLHVSTSAHQERIAHVTSCSQPCHTSRLLSAVEFALREPEAGTGSMDALSGLELRGLGTGGRGVGTATLREGCEGGKGQDVSSRGLEGGRAATDRKRWRARRQRGPGSCRRAAGLGSSCASAAQRSSHTTHRRQSDPPRKCGVWVLHSRL